MQYSTMNILKNGIEVFRGNNSAEFEAEFKLRRGFLQAWADSPDDLTIYTMDLAPFKAMIGMLKKLFILSTSQLCWYTSFCFAEHENVTEWPNPRACHNEVFDYVYNLAHHDECHNTYLEAYTSLLGSALRVFLMWDLTQLGISRSKLAGLCLDMDDSTMLRGEDVISIPEQLLDTEMLQVAWTWPGAIEAAIKHSEGQDASVIKATGKNDHVGTFDFDRSHWKAAIEIIRKVSGACWEDWQQLEQYLLVK